jgi:hypothetical protein
MDSGQELSVMASRGKDEAVVATAARRAGLDLYPLPRDGFEPSAASDDKLRKFGLPTLNRMASNPLATAFRRAFLKPPATGEPLRFMQALQALRMRTIAGVIPLAAIASLQPAQKSLNWSGGYIAPRNGRSFVSVMGKWTVPTVSIPPGGTAPEYRSSTWIGLDGQRFYLDSSLPQIGTKQRHMAGPTPHAVYGAWFQWWARGQDTAEIDLLLPVDPGDEISAIITVLDDTTVRCNLKNETQGVILQAFNASAPGPCRISGATAEWIMERPSPMGSDGWDAYDLPVYTSFAFTGCAAESIAPGSAVLADHDLERTGLIRMYEITANPTSVRTISTARRILDPVQQLELAYVAP